MRHSIRIRLTIIVCALTAGGMFASWFISIAFFENYYMDKKMHDLIDVYKQVSIDFSGESSISETKHNDLVVMCETAGVSLFVVDYSMNVEFLSGYNIDENGLKKRLLDLIFEGDKVSEGSKYIEKNDKYTIQTVKDAAMGVEYLEMWGTLESGNTFVMRATLESIKEIVTATNDFYAYVILIVLLLSIVITIIISMNFTKPILKLVHISERMSNLEFDVKYASDSDDELSVLGNSMNKLSEKLESTISELKTANINLQKDIEQKTQIDEMRKEFVSNVSHELKTPIALIQGYAEGLKEGVNEDAESRDFYCDVIIDEANKMNKLVRQLITLNQIESGQNRIDMERFDIIGVIDEVLNASSILLKEKGAKVFFDNSKSIFVWSDEFQLQHIFNNYLSNAINHLDGDKIIKINVEEDKDRIRVSFYNTGEHIPDDSLDKIWIKFYKVDRARTREYGGSGIGLSIVKAIAESLEMEVGVNNVQDGVEFFVEISSIKW